MLAFTSCVVGDCLIRKINRNCCLRVFINTVEKLLQERLCNNNRQYKVIELIVLMYVGKERTYNNTKAVTCYCPRCMLTT